MVFSRTSSSSTVTIAAPPLPLTNMQSNTSHDYLTANQLNSAPGPSQPNQSQRLLSRVLPAHASLVDRSNEAHRQPATSHASARSSSPPRLVPPTTPSFSRSLDTTPLKSALRFTHPPPAPSYSYLQSMTPQVKRTRLSLPDSDSTTNGTSPLSQTSSEPHRSNPSSSSTGPLTSPSFSNVRPLSGISRPLPLPSTPSPSQRSPLGPSRNIALIPMPQRSIEDLEKILPPRQPPALRNAAQDSPRRALLQAIPPRPPLPVQAQPIPARPLAPAVETLPPKRGWSLTGFRSFDLDLDRIAEVVQWEHARIDGSQSSDLNNYACSSKRPHLGLADRGLPSGSTLEVLGPPGSGKSSLILQFAITERLRALGRARESLQVHEDADGSRSEPGDPNGSFDDSSYFSEEFWDAEIACADQVLIIDCEGALLPERIADAAWMAVTSLWASLRDQEQSTHGTDAETASSRSALPQQREAMPEEVRRLVAAVLAGIHVSRVTSLAGLIALLHSLRPTDELPVASPKKALPSSLPPRTSLILIDSLSYYIRSSGGASQHRKTAAQVSERIREMLLRLQKPFEHRANPELTAEEQQASKQRCMDAAARICAPTLVFTNQLGIRRGRNESEPSGRASPSGWSANGSGSNRSFNRGNARNEGSSMLAPLLNGTRPPQTARIRDERPAPSVALNGPEMWDESEPPSASPRQVQQLSGRNVASQPMGHDRGWPPSFLGQDVWRILLFRQGSFGDRYAQMVSVPPAVQSELSVLWAQTRERIRCRARDRAAAAAAAGDSAGQQVNTSHSADGAAAPREPVEAPQDEEMPANSEDVAAAQTEDAKEEQDKQMLELLSQLRASLFRWRPFDVSSRGLIS